MSARERREYGLPHPLHHPTELRPAPCIHRDARPLQLLQRADRPPPPRRGPRRKAFEAVLAHRARGGRRAREPPCGQRAALARARSRAARPLALHTRHAHVGPRHALGARCLDALRRGGRAGARGVPTRSDGARDQPSSSRYSLGSHARSLVQRQSFDFARADGGWRATCTPFRVPGHARS
jgi:hypothetical protein